MKTFELSLPEIVAVAATRGMAGAGIGLLTSDLMSRPTRRKVGYTLLAIGALSTIPILVDLLRKRALLDS